MSYQHAVPSRSSRVPVDGCSLILPVGTALPADDLIAAVEVLVRTAPADARLRLILAVEADLAGGAPRTAAAVEALSGDVDVVTGSVVDAAAAAPDAVVAVVDALARPDLAGLVPLVDRLVRDDDPLPFVHRTGLLLTHRETLAGLRSGSPTAEVPADLPGLARALRPRPAVPELRPTLSLPSVDERSPVAGSVTVVVVADAPLPALDAGLTRLQRHLPPGAEVVLVDPGGDPARTRALRTLRWARVVPGDELPGSSISSLVSGIAAATTEFVVLLDPVAWVTRRSLAGLVDALRRDPAAVAAGPLTNLGLGVQQAPDVGYSDVEQMEAFAEGCRTRSGAGVTPVEALVPGCVAVRRSALLAVGGLDASLDDPQIAWIDLCLRLRSAGGTLLRADGVFVHMAEMVRGTARGRWRFGGGGPLGLLRARHGQDADRALPGLLGAVMIVKNEEENLSRALESVSGVVDDVVVCDTGSIDGTTALIDACGARLTTFAWRDDFAAARNAALTAHTGTWGLLLDADETLDCTDPDDWRHWLARNSSDVVFLVCRNLESGTAGSTVDNASMRLLRADHCHWAGRIHEQMVRRDGRAARNSASDGARIIHDGYAVRKVLDRNKVDRNGELTRLELDGAGGIEGVPEDPGRAHFERGRAEMLAGRKDVAATHFRAAVELLTERSSLLRRMACCNLATMANERGEYAEALDFAGRAIDDECRYTQAALALAVATLKLDGADARTTARRVLEATVTAGSSDEDASIDALMTSLRDEGLVFGGAATLLGGLLLDAGESARAVELLLPLAQARPTLFEGWGVLHRALVEQRSQQHGSRQQEWAEVLAETAAPDPGVLEGLVGELSDDDRTRLFDALRRHGVEQWQVSRTERTWRALQPELRRMSRAALVAAARQQESDSPELALRLWRYAGDSPESRVGQARCLDAMSRPGEAADVLDGLDVAALEPADTLFVAALAAELGDAGLALALLDGLPADLDEALAGPSRQMRMLLTAH